MTVWPLSAGRQVTSPFGPRDGGFHFGVDFGRSGGSAGMPVYAPQSGTVLYAGAAQGYGGPDPAGWLVIQSAGGVWELGHIRRLPNVAVGSKVVEGQQVAVINPDSNTNGGTAPHLHVSYMAGSYDPARKSDPLRVLAGAKEPGGVVDSNKPDFNEYPLWSPNREPRGGVKVDLFLLHTEEGGGVKDGADRLARWMNNPSTQVSYHYSVSQDPADKGVTVVDVVDTDDASWSCLSANKRSINLVFAGSKASWSREQWLQQSRAIEVAAYLAVQDCKKYGIPLAVIAPPYSVGRAGISDHNYVTKVLRDGTHTDVGPGFPWDVFKGFVDKYSGVQAPPSSPPPSSKPSQQEMIVQVWEQLFGPSGKGWPQLGGKTLVDAVAELLKR